DVTYTPVGLGIHNATVNIASNDCDETPYDFAIRGELSCVAPTFTACPSAPVTANTTTGQCTAAVTYNVAADGTPAPALIYAFTGVTTGSGNGTGSEATFNQGNTIVTVTATNFCGTPTCSFTVTVSDSEQPTLAIPIVDCSSLDIPNVNECMSVATEFDATTLQTAVAALYTDNCTTPTATLTNTTAGMDNTNCSWNFLYEFTISDGIPANNVTCTVARSGSDQTPPTAVCKESITVYLDEDGMASIEPEDVDDGSYDNCGEAVTLISVEQNEFDCDDKGSRTVTLTVRDACGLTNTCLSTVEVVDDSDLEVVCPNPITVSCASNVPAPAPSTVNVSNDCGSVTTSHLFTTQPYDSTCANRFKVTRYYQVMDASNNTASCSQEITVYDNTQPVFSFVPANTTVQCNSVPVVGTPIASDNCNGTVSITYNSQNRTNGSCTDSYVLVRQWTATDACGNTRTATQRISVIDTQKPAFVSIPANVTVQCSAIPAVASPTATDNCDASVAITYIGQTKTSGACANAYTLTRRWAASDNCNNNVSISQRITVVDNTKPVFTAFPANTTISCSDLIPPIGSATATDGCGTALVVYLGQTSVSGSCVGNYHIRRTWGATDACGNSTVSTQTIQVSDTGVPVFTSVPGPLTVECTDPVPPLVNPTASDACSGYVHITLLGQVATGSGCAADYTITRTWRADDLCGQTATTFQVITVLGTNYGPQETQDRAAPPQLKTQNSKLKTVSLTPNPTADLVLIGLGDFAGETVVVSIYSDLGRLVWERKVEAVADLKLPVNLREAGAAAGMYTVVLRSGEHTIAKRLVYSPKD
ncbi:MAG: hypothetical protein ACKVU2_01705, partial [Saprospiraceae bacterium]